MNNFQRIRQMNIDELSEFIVADKVGMPLGEWP